MAELVQGQNAPVGMKAEGFVDALHRVRQVWALPTGGSSRDRGGAGPGRTGRRGSGLGAGGSPSRRLDWARPFRRAPAAGSRWRMRRRREARSSLSGGSPRCLEPLGKDLPRAPSPVAFSRPGCTWRAASCGFWGSRGEGAGELMLRITFSRPVSCSPGLEKHRFRFLRFRGESGGKSRILYF